MQPKATRRRNHQEDAGQHVPSATLHQPGRQCWLRLLSGTADNLSEAKSRIRKPGQEDEDQQREQRPQEAAVQDAAAEEAEDRR